MSTANKVLEKKGRDILSVSPDTAVFDAIEKMAERSAGTALVMDGDRLVGIISERDFIRKTYLKKKCGEDIKVSDIMSADLTTVSPDESLENCMNLMTDKRIRHLPVLDGGKVAGIISIGDLVKYMVSEKDFLIENLQSYIAGPGM